jgi:alpha-beta hydrolase superfamily lysophospholipase
MNPSKPARPLYLNGETEGVFALFHDASDRRGDTAVLLCPPFGLDPICLYRKQRDWAEHLAAGGYPTLQIDLPGSGDSAGKPDDPARLQAWTQAASAAALWLRAASGAPRIVAVGVGLGGLVSYRAAFEQAPIDDLVLWAVPARGRALVRELRVYSRLPVSSVLAPGDPEPPLLPEGAVLAAGYLLSAETAAALEALDLTELPLPNAKQRRVLLLGRSGPTADELLRGSLERTGVEVTVASGRGYGAINEMFERVGDWLAEGEAHRDRLSAAVELPAPRGALSAEAEEPSSQEHLRLSCAGVELRETPVWVDRPSGRLFGVLTESLHAQAPLCAVLLAGQGHTGPNRMWVEIARRWAARGVPTLRIEPSWLVDSDGDASMDAGALFGSEYVDETCEALEILRARGLPRRFVLLGMCAGAYWSMHAALRDERIAAIIMLNPGALIWSEQVQVRSKQVQAAWNTRSLRRRLLYSSTLRKVLGGEVAPRRFVEVSRSLATLAARAALDRSRPVAGPRRRNQTRPDPVEPLLDALRDRGQRGLLVLTGREPLREELAATGLFDRADRWPNLELLTIGTSSAAGTHMFSPLWLQRQVHQLVDGVLDRELERVSERAISTST